MGKGLGRAGERHSDDAERTYLPRLVDPLITELLAGLPAVSIVNPRASGKTTTARRHARTVVRLDCPDEAAAFQASPDAVLRGLAEPVLLTPTCSVVSWTRSSPPRSAPSCRSARCGHACITCARSPADARSTI